jgi:rod shape-determining protein MreD
MKKFIFYFIIYFAVIFLQFGWVKYFSPYGISPDFILILVIFIGLMLGPMAAQLMGFFWGLGWDVMSTGLFGSHAMAFTIVGFLAGLLSKQWNESKVATQILLTGFATVFFWVLIWLITAVFGGDEFKFEVNYLVVSQTIYNMLIAPLIFWFGARLMALLPRDLFED